MDKTQKLGAIVAIILLIVFSAISFNVLAAEYSVVEAQWQSENKCIAEKVSLGIPRANISRAEGSCKVEL